MVSTMIPLVLFNCSEACIILIVYPKHQETRKLAIVTNGHSVQFMNSKRLITLKVSWQCLDAILKCNPCSSEW